ncbi:MAG TPA: 50S ribosomal protein L7ae-like protein [Clostridiales bacterium UBA8960]|nr:50S ribosomal protein L7ae-like protein [Clostridiales bacterium UBA8960]
MQQNELAKHSKISVGVKQSTKAIQLDKAKILYVAKDADNNVINPIIELATEKAVDVVFVETMKELGRACNIDVGAATAVIEK